MIHYLKGDATQPQTEGPAIIVHVCNDIGAWGAGFVLAISRRWPQVEDAYRDWAEHGLHKKKDEATAPLFDNGPALNNPEFKLGSVQFVRVPHALIVANLIGQRDIRRKSTDPAPVRYHAIRKGLARVREVALLQGASVHMPRIGCGLAGGIWEEVEDLILTELASHGVDTYIYDYN